MITKNKIFQAAIHPSGAIPYELEKLVKFRTWEPVIQVPI